MKTIMWKRLMLLATACTSLSGSLLANEIPLVQLPAVLKNESELSAKLAVGQVKIGTFINASGFTIIGALYVAGVIAKNTENSKVFVESQQVNYKEKPLKDIFNMKLQSELNSAGVTLSLAVFPKKQGGIFSFDPAEIKTKWAILVGNITSQYIADGGDAPYKPQAHVSVFLQDMQDKDSKLTAYIITEKLDDPKFTFSNFEKLQENSKLAYSGLEVTVVQLAKKLQVL